MRLSFSPAVFPQGGEGFFGEVFAGKKAAVALQVELQPAAVKPVHRPAALIRRDQLVHHHMPVILHVAAVSADHAVQTDLPKLRIDLGPAAPGTDIDPVAGGPGLSHRPDRRLRNPVLIVHQSSIHV